MYNEPILLQPVFQERIWGGQKLKTQFNYDLPFEQTGEAWVISAHPNGPSVIKNGPLAGKTLLDAWENHGSLFNKSKENENAYPLLVKILDAADDLSVQVHPDDQFAREVEKVPYGKTECWYVLHAEEGAELILGHHAETQEELDEMINNGEWDQLLRRVPVIAGDFVYVPSGTVHAIGKGIVILEIQQSSDITYRVYDYERTDAAGNKRELHLDRAKQVTTIPHQDITLDQTQQTKNGMEIKKLVEETYFSVYHWTLNGEVFLTRDGDFLQASVIGGAAKITIDGNHFEVEKGSHFIIPATVEEFIISGNAEIVVSHS
ncbi:mannose-6-phosphate isomerase [Gracilibacillus halotolerans]|uniref:Mannose-6-phosphate isomerase n=1 Tax=Gracilibacillus halotolerans TaxID=74386 RepID=A0A841RM33_9BACI|nr:mannose-6-phosphate isomerase, class I [Gracilibacillus halotolerans]MBB6512947.1 mannose-6-phosphate isomerase [Gracilibacillus halotolerans]